ncbi:P-II family nitrogen regulator [Antarctobacter heliothermus]|uniref:Nitrogen regulatory protein P-II n=1 Tax=Antarctobacter heliothermus TaxID=74033 RepID=A0A239CF26_9RHOB|nr:transcriptional regulator [Antarctobacter heliothermus]SNS18835.1 nitrogen regulatory protein P-II family [Antarctobacter heliothermus]
MQTHKAKRVEIIIERVMERRLTEAMTRADVTGWSVLPMLGGSGRSGEWSREGQISRGTGLVQVVCIIRPEKLDPLLDQVFSVVERQIGVVSVCDCEILRAERF